MTAPDSFATSADVAAYDFTPAPSDGQLARATQAIRDAAGIPLTQTTSTATLTARCGELEFPGPLVTAVTSVQLDDDGTLTDVSAWRLDKARGVIVLGRSLPWHQRHHALYQVTYLHGFGTLPPALVMLTCSVAYRLQFTRADATAGLQSKTVGSVSWTVSAKAPPADALSEDECCRLARIVPLRRAWMVAT
jgi:hypothetical protein